MPVIPPIAYKLNIKRAIINGLRAVFDNNYPDLYDVLPSLNITMEYPEQPEEYPTIIVDYTESGVLQSAGVGHFEYFQGPNVYERWMYQGAVNLTIAAETSLQRDYISDHIVHLMAFGSTSEHTHIFVPYLEESHLLDIQVLKDTLRPGGESIEASVNWGLSDARIYTTRYSFDVLGTFISGIVYGAYIKGVNTDAQPY